MSRQQRKESKVMNDISTSCLIANLLVLNAHRLLPYPSGRKFPISQLAINICGTLTHAYHNWVSIRSLTVYFGIKKVLVKIIGMKANDEGGKK